MLPRCTNQGLSLPSLLARVKANKASAPLCGTCANKSWFCAASSNRYSCKGLPVALPVELSCDQRRGQLLRAGLVCGHSGPALTATPCSQRPSAAVPGVPGTPDTHCAVQPGRQPLAHRLLQEDSMYPVRLAKRLREAGVAASRGHDHHPISRVTSSRKNRELKAWMSSNGARKGTGKKAIISR